MITTLTKIKDRLSITDTSKDALLTQFIIAAGALFDVLTDRTLERSVGFQEEFSGDRLHVPLKYYPVEEITRFEQRLGLGTDWAEVVVPNPLLRADCVLSLETPLADRRSQIRITYTGGYVFPPNSPPAGAHPLPAILEAAAIEQAASWYKLEATTGVLRVEKGTGTFLEMGDRTLVPWVKRVLNAHRRLVLG